MSQPLLSVNGLMMRFGGLLAVNNVNLELYPQENRLCLIGLTVPEQKPRFLTA